MFEQVHPVANAGSPGRRRREARIDLARERRLRRRLVLDPLPHLCRLLLNLSNSLARRRKMSVSFRLQRRCRVGLGARRSFHSECGLDEHLGYNNNLNCQR